MQKKSSKMIIYFLLFAVSGFSGLIYESVWTRYLKLFLGHSAYAQTLVLVIFMGGMALGSWLASRHTLKVKNLLFAYALAEAAIGAFGLVFHPLFTSITDYTYLSFIPGADSLFMVNFFKWVVGAAFILPQSVLLGATFPLMSAGIIRRYPGRPGNVLAVLYFTNSFGAAIGVLASSFFLVDHFGLPGTMITAGVINLILAAIVAAISRESFEKIESAGEKAESLTKIGMAFMFIAALTGTASFIYEIGWIRMLSMLIGSTTHAFDIMLSAFILGIAVGGFAIRKVIDRLKNPVLTLAIVQLLMGTFAILTLAVYGGALDLLALSRDSFAKTDSGFLWFNVYSYGISILIMLPATICAGMTLPLITYFLLHKGYGEKSIGRVYAANTAGSILGVLLAFHLLMPLAGLQNMITVGGAIDILLGIALLLHALPAEKKRIAYYASSAGVVMILSGFLVFELNPLKMATSLMGGDSDNIQKEVVFHKDGKTSTIDVIGIRGENLDALGMFTNGNPLGVMSMTPNAVINEHNAILLAAIPMSLHNEPVSAATFGLGTGLTAHVLASNPIIESLDVIEIEQGVVDGAGYFGEKIIGTLENPKLHIRVDDAKTFFSNRNRKYDIIVSDPTEPWVSGIADLYSDEFYGMISRHLTEDGLFAQWILSGGLDVPLVLSVVKAISLNFPDYCIYNVNDNFLIIIAGKKDIPAMPSERLFYYSGLKDELARIGVMNSYDIFVHRLCGKGTLEPLLEYYDIEPNSDYYPLLENESPKTHFLGRDANELLLLRLVPAPFTEVLEGWEPPGSLKINMLNADFTVFTRLPKQGRRILSYFRNADEYSYPEIFIKDKNTLNILKSVMNMHAGCGAEWIASLRAMMQLTLPYMTPEEMEWIFSGLRSADGYALLPLECVRRINLFHSLGRRDYSNTLEISSALLPKGTIPSNADNDFLLTAHALSLIALDKDLRRIDSLFRRFDNPDPPIYLKILKQYSKK